MFEADKYEVREKSFSDGHQHKIYEGGELILYSRIDEDKVREDLVFVDQDDERKLTVTTNPKLDVPVSYSIVDEEKDEVIGGLRREWGFLRHEWKVINGENKVIGKITEDFLPLALTRRFLTSLFPFRYDVTDNEGNKIADINGELKFRDIYNINISGDVDPKLIVPSAIIIDSIEKK